MPRKKPNVFAAFMNSSKVVAWLLVLVAVGCGVGALVAYGSATVLRDRGVRVQGEVVEVHTERRDNYVVVRFSDVKGDMVRADVGNYIWDPTPSVGDRPRLVYDPDDPSGNVADARAGPDFFSVGALVVGALLAAMLVAPTWTGRLDWTKLR